jgi:hypothetical protein
MRARLTLGTIALTAALLLPSAAVADTLEIGSANPMNSGPTDGCSGCHSLQAATDPASPSYVVPAAPAGGPWTLTSWSARGGFMGGTASVEVWRPTSTPNEFRLIAIGPVQSFEANTVVSHAVNIPVEPGDHLGIQSLTGDFSPSYETPFAADIDTGAIGDPAVGQTVGAPTSDFDHLTSGGMRINAAATLTAPSVPAAPTATKKKCKKKKHKRSAESAKKKCKKHKKHKKH